MTSKTVSENEARELFDMYCLLAISTKLVKLIVVVFIRAALLFYQCSMQDTTPMIHFARDRHLPLIVYVWSLQKYAMVEVRKVAYKKFTSLLNH